MSNLVKPWNDGGSLTATYDGSGDGSAVFSSDMNDSIDREMPVVFKDMDNYIRVERMVRQAGMREEYITPDGEIYMTSDSEIYGCIK